MTLTLSVIALPTNTFQAEQKVVMEPNNELSELMIRYEPVFPCQKKGNHTPHKSRKYMKNRQIGGDQNGEIV